ncbi:hypothetical protein OAW_10540 [Vibrio cyclitrophicus ZF170]|uniref:Uncharacterized protein n=1 Tax=Vibrio cyclitrophicus TaxID=47951 RepID=A0A7Z1MEC6_9VIBR|nr:hypothetical protein [Vibrio cyclitrophicus]OED68725.1 hypothetical protein OAU_11430 [Vibrio cyclitrophicus ZF99]OEE17689.1 hypothetical protein OAY_10495 [Vibrio cyclitrophicus ZF205]OEE22053.1 hypothetical protein OAW_10540 [Vibrio cyclitrophicus ZF170]OEE48558.1 hypothetical protein OAG_10295 [Vibrio cyclitrophicus FF75]OEE83805.1 hypothetical protein OAI_22330 [Vibrio cyclitrophicus FF160]OEF40170.1 hypothetical protein OAE_21855 [Vibrio cyclitrophicus 1F289]OEF45695.1 hypothetical p
MNATARSRIKGVSQPVLGVAKVSIFELRLQELEFGVVSVLDASAPKKLAYSVAMLSENVT